MHIIFNVFYTSCTTPTLGAILFTLSLDVARARKHVTRLAEGARDQTLTVEQYRQASEAIRVINSSWQAPLGALAGVAAYSTIGMLVYMAHNSTEKTADDYFDDYDDQEFTEHEVIVDIFRVAQMGKETTLLFLFTSLARLVNDEADDVVTDVFQWRPNQLLGDEENNINLSEIELLTQQVRRLQVVMEGADLSFMSPRDRANRTSMWRRIVSTKEMGRIQFEVLGIRWTSQYVQALAVSFAVSIISTLASKYYTATTSP